jgi:hypothetical protein
MERYYTGLFEAPPILMPPALPEDIYLSRLDQYFDLIA